MRSALRIQSAIAAALSLLVAGCGSITPERLVERTVQTPVQAPVQSPTLLGVWTVDLRPRPDAPAYLKTLVVTAVSGKTFEGQFYDSPITQGRLNTEWGSLRIAFVTEDASGPYHHSAVLSGARLEGLTNSTGRDFLAHWSAVKQP